MSIVDLSSKFNIKAHIASLGNPRGDPKSITVFRLVCKNVQSLEADTFAQMINLQEVILLQCNLLTLPKDLFKHNPNLKIVSFNYNYLTSIPSSLFDHNPLLRQVFFVGNKLEYIHFNLFKNNPRLTTVKLNENYLSSLPSSLFDHNTLLNLSLDGNQFSSLPSCNFFHIRILHLDNNEFTSFPPDAFQRLPHLRTLSLVKNKLTSLPPNIFQSNQRLKRLDIRGNEFSSFLDFPFGELFKYIPEGKIVELKGFEEIEARIKEKKKNREAHEKNFKYVCAEIEIFPPQPKNYSHLPVFRNSYLAKEGGIEFVKGLEEFKELSGDDEIV